MSLRENGGNAIDAPVCKAASSTVVITPENKLAVPCYHLSEKEFEIKGDLYGLYHSSEVRGLGNMEGRLKECEGCTINCYMQPSFTVNMNSYWWKSLRSNLKYNLMKGTWKSLF